MKSARHYNAKPLIPVGNLQDDAVRTLSDRIKLRALAARGRNVMVYVDERRDVYGINDDASWQLPDSQLIGVYNRKALLGDIACDLIVTRDGR